MQEHYDNFFEDVFVECEDKYGQVEEMNVCDNLGDHLVGNVYVKFKKEEVTGPQLSVIFSSFHFRMPRRRAATSTTAGSEVARYTPS